MKGKPVNETSELTKRIAPVTVCKGKNNTGYVVQFNDPMQTIACATLQDVISILAGRFDEVI